ncbi:MAG: 50S ribosomal protein L9 [Rhodospirillaceae bacterium]|nr:50S ribosomal protein L9 [Rhodospirillaceae bacterium]
MEVILMERIAKLGQMGDVVNVKPGFARNYLLPKGKARRATKENIAHFETQKAQLETQNLERRADAEAVAGKMNDVSVVLVRQAGEAGQLYGSVNARDIADAVTKAGYDVNRNQVSLDQPIKMLGLHPVVVNLHPEVDVTVIANVARSADEAETQAKTGTAVLSQAEEEARAEAEVIHEAAADEAVAEQAETMFEDGAAPEATDEVAEEAGEDTAPEVAASDETAEETTEETADTDDSGDGEKANKAE